LSIGACTQIASDETHSFLPQWIEHHKLLGVTHFWIYINEPWNGTSISKYIQQQQLQTPSNKENITFVLFDYQWHNHESHVQRRLYNWAFFRNPKTMNVCIKVVNMVWIG
jgi:Glycosyltransferase family 92